MKNVAIILLSIAVVALGCLVLYDKVLKDKNTNNSENEKQSSNSTTTDETQNLSADEMYTVYLSNLEKNIENHFKENNFSDEEAYKYESENPNSYVYGSLDIYYETADRGIYGSIFLDEKGLSIFVNEKQYNIDNNVVQMFLVEEGQAGYAYLYYIKNDGKVYVVGIDENIEYKVEDVNNVGKILETTGDFEFKTKEVKGLKNIVNITDVAYGLLSGRRLAIFTDIEGNLFRSDNGNIVKFQ